MNRAEQVDQLLGELDSPTAEDVQKATYEFDAGDVAAAAAKRALAGGGGGGGDVDGGGP